jgi:DNA-binding transcriptional ArsR family regulator
VSRDPLQPQRCAQLLSALAAPERLRIIRYLRDGPRNVGEIAAMLKTAPVNVSHHLTVLRHAGLVRSRKQGRYVLYSLPPGVLQAGSEADPTEHLNLGCCRLELPQPGGRPAEEV